MAVVLTATGLFLYLRLESGLDESDRRRPALARRRGRRLVVRSDSSLQPEGGRPDRAGGELRPGARRARTGGRRFVRGPRPSRSSRRRRSARARSDTIIVDHDGVRGVDGGDGAAAGDAGPVSATRSAVVVVGTSLEDRNETLGEPRQAAADRRADRAAAGVPGRIRRRRRRPCARSSGCAGGRPRSPPPSRA